MNPRNLFALCSLIGLLLAVPGRIHADEAAPTSVIAQEAPEADSGNKQLFTPVPRELQLPPGSQDKIAVGTLAGFLLLGAWLLFKTGAVTSTFTAFTGVTTFYSGLVHHKWVISGHYPVGTGHLISLALCAVGVAVAILGFRLIAKTCKSAAASKSRLLYPVYILIFTLGCFTGHATIFEAGPTIFGIDMQLQYLAITILLGSAAVTASLLFIINAMAKMRLL